MLIVRIVGIILVGRRFSCCLFVRMTSFMIIIIVGIVAIIVLISGFGIVCLILIGILGSSRRRRSRGLSRVSDCGED